MSACIDLKDAEMLATQVPVDIYYGQTNLQTVTVNTQLVIRSGKVEDRVYAAKFFRVSNT